MSKLIKLILLLSPLAYMAGKTLVGFDILIFHISCCLLIVTSLFLNKTFRLDKFLCVLMVPCLASSLMNGFQEISVFSTVNVLLTLVLISSISDEKNLDLTNIFIIVSVISILISALSIFGFSPIIDNPKGEPGAMFGNTPRLCYYLAITMPFVVKKIKWTIIFYSLLGILFKEIYLTIFAGILLIKDLSKYMKLRTLSLLVSISAIMFFIAFKGQIIQSLAIRWLVWGPVLTQSFAHPLFGHGLGLFPYVSNQFVHAAGSFADNAFSSLLQFFFSCGLTGLILLGYIIYKLKPKGLLNPFLLTPSGISLIFFGVLSLFEYPFEVPKLWLTICAIIAIYLSELNKKGALCN